MKNSAYFYIAMAFLSSCASDVMKGYVGKDVTEAVIDYGPPTNIIELNEGKRAYQWKVNSTGYIPQTTNYSGGVSVIGNTVYDNRTATTTGGYTYSTDCLYTLFASGSGEKWLITGFREPSFECQ